MTMRLTLMCVALSAVHFTRGEDDDYSNIAKGKMTLSSSSFEYAVANLIARPELAVDGNHDGMFISGRSCYSSGIDDMKPYWMVDLGGEFHVEVINITNRADCCAERLRSISVEVYEYLPMGSDSNGVSCGFIEGDVGADKIVSLHCPAHTRGRFVYITKTVVIDRSDVLTLCEVEVHGHNKPKVVQHNKAYLVEVESILNRAWDPKHKLEKFKI